MTIIAIHQYEFLALRVITQWENKNVVLAWIKVYIEFCTDLSLYSTASQDS